MAKKLTSTSLRVYLLDKSYPGKEEGIVMLCDERGKLTKVQEHFDSLNDLPASVRKLLAKGNVKWPR